MAENLVMRWSEFVRGSVKGTIFEDEEWVRAFVEFETVEEAARFFNKHFDGLWKMSADAIPCIKELHNSPWALRYAMMCLFHRGVHPLIRLFISKEELESLNLEYFRFRHYENHGRWMSFRTEFTPFGNIAVLDSFAPLHPDGEQEYIFRIYSRSGESLSAWQGGSAPLDSSGYYELKNNH